MKSTDGHRVRDAARRNGRRIIVMEGDAGSKHEAAYELIRSRIVAGEYGPGYRLVLEQLAREFGVSAVPVREAVRRLEAEGYVEFIRNVGARVAHLDTGEYQQAMQTLAVLEGYATAAAAPRMRKTDITRARSLNQQMSQALTAFDPAAFTELNHRFHDVILQRCPNSHIRTLTGAEWARLDRVRRTSFAFIPGRAHGSITEHEHLVHLIETGADVREIEFAARDHKLGTLRAIAERTAPLERRAKS
ncbi:GntR family transcriptional regulator [Nocardia sp. NPDC060256]|uniref:GntR family transcriptional regulator n=1 Tax=unclassified Nocardia TaxID=2637762 RepID=UPI0036483CDE